MTDPAVKQVQSIEDVWQRIANTTTRGISVYSDETSQFELYTYSDLMAYAAQAAVVLESMGIGWQEKVIITAHTSHSFIITWLGLMLLGATPVPLPPKKTLAGEGAFKQRIQPLLEHHRFVLCGEADQPDILEAQKEDGRSLSVIRMEDVTDGLELETGRTLLRGLLERGFHSRYRQLGLDDDAFIQYTSGSTGQPKGTVISLRNILANVRAMAEAVHVVPEHDTFLSWLPLYHDMGLVGMLLNCTFNTTALVMVPPTFFARRPLTILKLVGMFKATHCVMPNFGLEWVLRALSVSSRPERFHLNTLKWLGVGSEPISPKTLRLFQEAMDPHGLHPAALSPCYGMAEATLAVAVSQPGTPYKLGQYLEQVVPCVGPLVRGFEVKIEPFEGSGHTGVIKIRGESVSRYAYVGAERIDRLDSDGFHDTHDIGFLHEGELAILGRSDEMFIINGVNCFPYDLEMVVRALPGVGQRRVACFGVPQPSGRYRIVVLYEARDLTEEERRRNAQRIREELLNKTGLQPDEILAVQPKAITVTTSGKIQRKKILALYQAGKFDEERVMSEADARSA
ncbi:AMP-binding protein [Vitiosangium sp. GDMCC 1.1324]|uniref:AMP-binding protein n=1 Tax=Vitiosangium sp. (strain GDMCC 1.1324) TaxID=2138576 RepID=UPI00130D74C4|nr:AMP-binding protein [Vitiosangium sp. GDMCC 1.1324]